jgi:hypothetical protein
VKVSKRSAVVVAFALSTGLVCAQGRNFAGTWTPDPAKNQGAPHGGGGAGTGGGRMQNAPGSSDMVITLDAASFVISRTGGGGESKTTYRLDGKATTNGSGPNGWSSRARWDGNTLVVSMSRRTPTGEQRQTARYSLEGDDLVQAVERPAFGTAPAVTSKTYFKRK